MDIGQMGGGDKLFEKIDQGIRASKVILCCVTERYAKSPNCNREVATEMWYSWTPCQKHKMIVYIEHACWTYHVLKMWSLQVPFAHRLIR